MNKQSIQEYIWWLLLSDDNAVEQVILELYRQQTNDEQGHHISRYRNRRGFSTAHARMGSYLAEQINAGNYFSGLELDQARRIAMHYVKQTTSLLNNIDISLPDMILDKIKKETQNKTIS
jgi:hypothetical protein